MLTEWIIRSEALVILYDKNNVQRPNGNWFASVIFTLRKNTRKLKLWPFPSERLILCVEATSPEIECKFYSLRIISYHD
jgi:hypothetical protein